MLARAGLGLQAQPGLGPGLRNSCKLSELALVCGQKGGQEAFFGGEGWGFAGACVCRMWKGSTHIGLVQRAARSGQSALELGLVHLHLLQTCVQGEKRGSHTSGREVRDPTRACGQ